RARLNDRRVALAARDHGIGLARVRVREPVRLAAWVYGRPADARHTLVAQTDRAAWDEPKARSAAVLLPLVEGDLRTEADAEDWPVRGVALAQHVDRSAETFHRGARRADTGQDGEIGLREVVDELHAEAPQCELNRADVPRAVPGDRDRRHRTPF